MDVNQEMLNAAVKEAVKVGLIPKFADEENYLKNWNMIESVLKAALTMKKKFIDEKPSKGGDYWYYGYCSKKPIIAQWNTDRQEFQGDADSYGPHGFTDPEYWAEIEYP